MKRFSSVLMFVLVFGLCCSSFSWAQEKAINSHNIQIRAEVRILDMNQGVVESGRHVTGLIAELTHLDLPEVHIGMPVSPELKGAIHFLQNNAKEIYMSVQCPDIKVKTLDGIFQLPKQDWQGLVKARVNIHVIAIEAHYFHGQNPTMAFFPVVTDIENIVLPSAIFQIPVEHQKMTNGIWEDPQAKACSANMRVVMGAVEMYNMDHQTPMTQLNLEELVAGKYLTAIPTCSHKGTYSIVQHPTAGSWVECSFHSKIQY